MENLFTEFTPVTKAQWKEQIAKDLKGTGFDQLKWETHNGITIDPFYTAEDISSPRAPLFSNSRWDICVRINVSDERAANAEALKALSEGASGIAFHIHKKINTPALIKDISLEHIYSRFVLSNDSLHVLDDLKTIYGSVNPHDGKMKCFVDLDPLSLYAYYGEWHDDEQKDLSVLERLQHIPVNVGLYEEAGAGTVDELAIGLAHANEHLNYLSQHNGFKNKKAFHCSFSVAPDFFTEIAKLRAWRKLIGLLQEQYQLDLPLHIHVHTARIDKSSLDAYTNMLRTTTEAMSAVIGGADSLCVTPYNEVYETVSDFSRRIAINQQHILKDESYLDKVADIASGSYYIESLTDALAEKAWEQFKTIESKGGFIACMKSGLIQDRIEEGAAKLMNELHENKLILVGVNKFQNAKEEPKKTKASKEEAGSPAIRRIRPIRLAKEFEEKTAGAPTTN